MNLTTLNVLDGLIIIIVGWNLIRGFNKGFVEEVLSIIGIIFSIYAAYIFAPQVTKLLIKRPDQTTVILSGISIFAILFVVSKYVAFHINRKINKTPLGIFNNILGFFFGIIRGWLIASVAVFLVAVLTPDGYLIKKSSLGGIAVPVVDRLIKFAPVREDDPLVKRWRKAETYLRKNFTLNKYFRL